MDLCILGNFLKHVPTFQHTTSYRNDVFFTKLTLQILWNYALKLNPSTPKIRQSCKFPKESCRWKWTYMTIIEFMNTIITGNNSAQAMWVISENNAVLSSLLRYSGKRCNIGHTLINYMILLSDTCSAIGWSRFYPNQLKPVIHAGREVPEFICWGISESICWKMSKNE